jgi:hypothetical protein
MELPMTALEQVAAWVRFEISDEVFEAWLYENYTEVGRVLGPELAFELIELDFRAPSGLTARMKRSLANGLTLPPRACLCAAMGDRAQAFDDLRPREYVEAKCAELKSFYGWGALFLLRCRECMQRWCLFGEDNDCYFLRLDAGEACAILERDAWPQIFLDWMARRKETGGVSQIYAGADRFRRMEINLDVL